MTQPPDEQPPDEWWQPPGPPPAQPPPPYQPNPYGGANMAPYQPIDSGGMSSAVKTVLGVVIGLFGGFFLWIVAVFSFAAGSGSGDSFLVFAAVAPLVVPAPLLIWRATRPWAVGLLIGTAISSIGLSSLCSAMLSGL